MKTLLLITVLFLASCSSESEDPGNECEGLKIQYNVANEALQTYYDKGSNGSDPVKWEIELRRLMDERNRISKERGLKKCQ